MLLSGALLALFMTGFWLYCLTDIILTPAAECRGIPKAAWIVVIALTFTGGAVGWLIVRPPARHPAASFTPPRGARGDRPAPRRVRGGWVPPGETGRAGPWGPDDDPEFLRALDRAIRGNSQAGGEI